MPATERRMADIDFTLPAANIPRKLDQWRSILSEAFGPIEATRNSDENFSGLVRTSRRAQLQFNEISYRAQTLERTSQNVATFDQEYFTFGRPVAGPLFFEQNDRQFTVEPGCLVLLNQTSPYRATTDACYHAYSISIPKKMLLQRTKHIASFYKIEVSNKAPRGQLLAHFAQSMTDGLANWSESETVALREQLLDLIVLLMINDGNGYTSSYETSVKSAHRERAIAYIRHNHRDPNLNPKGIAGACGISVSYLHKIFNLANLQLETFIYSLRLESAKNMLGDEACRDKTVQQIAYHAGFNHPSHFSRLFKDAYGMSPSEYRVTQVR
jgi:AraC-like DNA-binding protein